MNDGHDFYGLLGVKCTATAQEIKAGWRTTMKRVHPDAGGTALETLRAQNAYETLMDPGRRRAYDAATLAGATGPEPDGFDSLFDDDDEPHTPEPDRNQWYADVLIEWERWRLSHPSSTMREWAAERRRSLGQKVCHGRTFKGDQCLALCVTGAEFCSLHRPGSSKCTASKMNGRPCNAAAYKDGPWCYQHQNPAYRGRVRSSVAEATGGVRSPFDAYPFVSQMPSHNAYGSPRPDRRRLSGVREFALVLVIVVAGIVWRNWHTITTVWNLLWSFAFIFGVAALFRRKR